MSWSKGATKHLTGEIVCSMGVDAYWASLQSRKADLYCRQATDQLADTLRLDGSSLMQQALKQGVLDPEQCCRSQTRLSWLTSEIMCSKSSTHLAMVPFLACSCQGTAPLLQADHDTFWT